MVAVTLVTRAARRLRVCPVCRLCLLTIRRAFVVRVMLAVSRRLARRVFIAPWLMRLAFSCARSGASGDALDMSQGEGGSDSALGARPALGRGWRMGRSVSVGRSMNGEGENEDGM
jgi:hypothetical protein